MYAQNCYIAKVISKFKNIKYSATPETDKILLINSWNEWGENMAIDPGRNNAYKYLLLIKSQLIQFLS